MEHYVTLFDGLYLPQGVALHLSMERHAKEYTLWVLCIDTVAYQVLSKLALPNVRLLQLEALETPVLKRVKQERTKREYCWTLTPFAPRFVFEADSTVNRVTYLDADMWFLKPVKSIFAEYEASGKQVMITDHAYSPEHDQSAASGQYCVQFMIFARHGGENVRQWWEDKCIEWCYARFENGLFGDQKYLDDWPERFPAAVHVMAEQDRIQGPWNATRFPYGRALVYHFHGVKLLSEKRLSFASIYAHPQVLINNIYKNYALDMGVAIARLADVGHSIQPQTDNSVVSRILSILRYFNARKWRFIVRSTLNIV